MPSSSQGALADQCGRETLAVQALGSVLDNSPQSIDAIVLVQRQQVRLLTLRNGRPPLETEGARTLNQPISAAAISRNGRCIVTIASGGISVLKIDLDGPISLNLSKDAFAIDGSATCAAVFDLPISFDEELHACGTDTAQCRTIAAVAVTTGKILLVDITQPESMYPAGSVDIDVGAVAPVGNSCDSLVVISRPGTIRLIGGMRSGKLLAVELLPTKQGQIVVGGPKTVLTLGDSSVQVSLEDPTGAVVLASCDGNAVRIDFGASLRNPEVNSIWFTDRSDRSSLMPVSAVCSAVQGGRQSSHTPLFALSSGKLLCGSLDRQPKPLPVRLRVPGTPRRVIYSEMHDHFFVASDVTYTSSRGGERIRYVASKILAVQAGRPSQKEPQVLTTLPPGQSIRFLLNWTFERDGKKYPFVVAATVDAKHDGSEAGSIIFFRVTSDSNEGLRLDVKKLYEEDRAVSAICRLGRETLLYATGSRIKMKTYPSDENR